MKRMLLRAMGTGGIAATLMTVVLLTAAVSKGDRPTIGLSCEAAPGGGCASPGKVCKSFGNDSFCYVPTTSPDCDCKYVPATGG